MTQDVRSVSPDGYRDQRIREGAFYCDICNFRWPMSHQRRMRGGLRVGVKCCYEPDGDDVERDVRRAMAARLAARVSVEHQLPPRAPDGSIYAGSLRIPASAYAAITLISPKPIVLSRGGAAVPVVITGVGFSATDAFAYEASGITDDSAPVLVSATEWNLSVKASLAMTAGLYSLTFNSTNLWPSIFDVR